ncbi:MAG TPA: DNA-directed RNA polymerase subunit omega [Clostridia bacterium]|nr:DNA-directed RNA polymerase subunit omega [Clostridia bacterium]
MEQPCLDKMMKRSDSKYALVVATAKRARQLTNGETPLLTVPEDETIKPVSMAMQEIAAGKIKIEVVKGKLK